jgi:hypothetical protein
MDSLLPKGPRLLTLGHLLIVRPFCQVRNMSKFAKNSQLYV